jgi:hypothetical protein
VRCRDMERSSYELNTVSQSCARDEGRPLGIGFQERVSNQSKPLCLRGMVVSVGSKAREQPVQVSIRETSASKPFDDASTSTRCRQNRRHTPPPGQVCRAPDYRADDGRRIGGVKRMQAFAWNCMNQALDIKGEAVAVKTVR